MNTTSATLDEAPPDWAEYAAVAADYAREVNDWKRKSTEPCKDCGYLPCQCEAMLEAHYHLYPEDEPAACGICSQWFSTGLSLRDGLCDGCWHGDRDALRDVMDWLYDDERTA